METQKLIDSILQTPAFAHLQKEVITLPGRADPYIPPKTILIMENCGYTAARRGRIDQELKLNPINLEFVDPLDQFGNARLYVDLAAVSFGDVPTLLEFMAMVPGESTVWVESAMKINPAMFEWINEMVKAVERVDREYLLSLAGPDVQIDDSAPDEIKKKSKRRRRSANS